jgi:hypothetical protein
VLVSLRGRSVVIRMQAGPYKLNCVVCGLRGVPGECSEHQTPVALLDDRRDISWA